MTIPDFQTLMLPLLHLASDCEEHSLSEAIDELGRRLQLTEDELQETLPSGRQARFDNRLGWASTYLRKAGLLETTTRGKFRITDTGLAVLSNPPDRITISYLQQFPGFAAFRSSVSDDDTTSISADGIITEQTPEEVMGTTYQQLRAKLASDLLDAIQRQSPKFFEGLVIDLLLAMGYSGSAKEAAKLVGKPGDEGIDGLINEDPLGLDVVYIQAKRWNSDNVDRKEIQAFVGALEGKKATKGVFITTSGFKKTAIDYARDIQKKIVLIDGAQLAQLLIDHNVGISVAETYVIKTIDANRFLE